jgi:hypothetical protein
MAVDIIITLTAISVDQGTLFNLYSDVDGFNIPYEEDVTSTNLLNGYTTSAPDDTTIVRVCGETVECLDCLDIIPEYTTTTTTTLPPASIACSETTSSGGYGVTEFVIALDSAGGVVIADFNAQGVPDKLEILHNGIKVATSGMDLIDNGGIAGFDDLYGDPTIPETWQAADSEWFIGSSKGIIPNREAEFVTDTGINGITANRQQLIWFQYDNADWIADQNAVVRVTGPTGTGWNLDIQCLPTYISLTADVSVINEGQSATFTVVSENIPDGTTVGWTIAGDLSADIVGGAITGTFTMIGNTDSVVITTIEDFLTEGPEAIVMQLDNPDSIGTVVPALFDTVIITDTSINTTTTTTTLATVECGASSVSGGVGVTEFIFDLNPTGDTLILDFNPQGVPDKLEIIHNGVKKATTGFAPVVNAGPFDNLYGDPTVPTVVQTDTVDQFIGTNKGVCPTRDAEFLADTGIGGITANRQQLVWWTYDATDYGVATTAIARVTGPDTTGWNLDRRCTAEYISLVADAANVNEGGTVTFTLTTDNVANGTIVGWTVTGVSSGDIVGGALTGSITINTDTGTQAFTLENDFLTEGPETLTLTLDATDSVGAATGSLFDDVLINDTSLSTTTTTTTAAPLTSFLASTTTGDHCVSPDLSPYDQTLYHDGVGAYPTIGDTVYTDAGGTTTFNSQTVQMDDLNYLSTNGSGISQTLSGCE